MGGDPEGQVSNWQGSVRVVGVVILEPVPDLSTAGAERMTYKHTCCQSVGEKLFNEPILDNQLSLTCYTRHGAEQLPSHHR